MVYNIEEFLLVQLSFNRLTLIKSARSSHVCLNYISTAHLYQSDNQNIRCHHNISRILFRRILGGPKNFERLIRLSATAGGSIWRPCSLGHAVLYYESKTSYSAATHPNVDWCSLQCNSFTNKATNTKYKILRSFPVSSALFPPFFHDSAIQNLLFL